MTGRFDDSVQFEVLGAVGASDGTGPLALGGPKQRTVLAVLVANHPNPVSADVLVDALYGDEPHDGAHRTIEAYISNLRRALGANTINRGPGGWTLRCDRADIDALHFEDEVNAQSDSEENPVRTARRLTAALEMWRGHPYADVEAHGLLDSEITRLNELRLTALSVRIDADLALGRHHEVVGELESLVASHSYNERLRAQHMLALYRSGRQKEALRSYQCVRGLLVEELGVEPGPRLQELELKILEQSRDLDLVPVAKVEERAVLVVDSGDPFASAFHEFAAVVESTVEGYGGTALGPAGTATYATFPGPAEAIAAASSLATAEFPSKLAVDFGEVDVSADYVRGPPLSRCARLVAISHPGQVLVSATAHAALSAGDLSGLRFESLGSHSIVGIEGSTLLFQLLVGSSERAFPSLEVDRVPPPVPGRSAFNPAGYELRRTMGDGSFGVLHSAYHPSTGREVVVEVIDPEVAARAEFIRRFEVDAQRLSCLQHPNLLAIIDFWRDERGAFLVYPAWRGGTAGDALSRLDRTRVVDQLASVLSYAHRRGVVHGSVSLDRLVLDEEGNAYLFGFPVGGQPPKPNPEYVSPENLDDVATVDDDIYAFAALARAIDRRELPDPDLPTLPRAELTGGATTIEQALSFIRGDELDHSAESAVRARSPYPGLAPFNESDAERFFGRDDVNQQIVDAMSGARFVGVIGPSGVGKSSVVRAGVLPAIRSGAIEGSGKWVITDMYPSADPFREIATALSRVATKLPTELRERILEGEPNVLADVLTVLPTDSDLLIVIDQFEELFTLTDRDTRRRFLELLHRSATNQGVRVLVTMRADFLDGALSHSLFGPLLRDNMVAVSAPSPAQIGEAIRKPAELAGVGVGEDLVDLVVADVHDRPGALPLMQHALSSAFDANDAGRLEVSDYQAVGGVEGSVARHAEEVWSDLDPTEQDALRQVLLRLVTFTDDSAPTRRRASVVELADLQAESPVDRFVAERLLVFDIDPETRIPALEVVHETLFSSWPRLRDWIDDLRDEITLSRRLDASVAEWESNNRSDEHLLSGGRLTQHQEWSEASDLRLSTAQQEFLAESVRRDQEVQRDRRQRRLLVMVGLVAVAAVAVVFGVVAQNNARDARAQELAASALAALPTDPELSVLLAIEALELNPDSSRAFEALHVALQSHRVVFGLEYPSVTFASISPGGDYLAATSVDERMDVWRLGATPEVIWSWDDPEARVVYANFADQDDRLYIFGDDPGSLEPGWRILNVVTGTDEFIGLEQPCLLPMINPSTSDGYVQEGVPLLVSRYEYLPEQDDCPDVRSPPFGAVGLETGRYEDLGVFDRSQIGSPTVSDDGTLYAVSAQDGQAGGVFDYPTNELVLPLPPGVATLSGDGARVLSGRDPMVLVDVQTGDRLAAYSGDFSIAYFSPDESLVVGSSYDGTVKVFETETGTLVHELRGPGSRPTGAQITQDNDVVASSHGGTSIRVWDIASSLFPSVSGALFEGPGAIGPALVLSERAFLPVSDGTQTIEFDLETGETLRTLSGFVWAAASDETFMVRQMSDLEFEVVDLETGAPAQRLVVPEEAQGPAWSGSVSPDNRYFAAGLASGYVVVWDISSGDVVYRIEGVPGLGPQVVFSPDGLELAVGLVSAPDRFPLARIDTVTWEEVDRIESLRQPLLGIEYASNGELIVGSDFAATIVVVDRETWEELPALEGGQGTQLRSLDVAPSGATIAAVEEDSILVWDLETMSLAHRLGFPGASAPLQSVAFVDESTLIVSDLDSTVLVTLDPASLRDIGVERVTRSFTTQECETYDIRSCPSDSDGS